ncbi:MAG: M28 family peptidase [Gemmatimonadetes bacterium]|nr:M28 family peptidase [Gemmatimonadota bacterium]
MNSVTTGDGLEHVRYLADTIGKRPTGFAGEIRAAGYQCEQLEKWGCEGVGTEEFPARSWDFDLCRVSCGPLGEIEALPIEFSASTPAGGLEAALEVREKPEADSGLEGRIALFCNGLPDGKALLDSNPAGVILVTQEKALAWHQIVGPTAALAGRLPMVTLGFADGVDLVRHGVDRLKLEIQTRIEDVTGRNVVATLPGASGDRRINISGHYDSVPAGGAAADNATGAACALEVVRSLSGLDLDATVDFVNFSAEEIGLYGAAAYAGAHASELTATELGIYFDGQGDFLGRNNIHIMGQDGLVDLVRQRCAETGYAVDLHHQFTGLDQAFLSAHGVPTLWFQRGPQLTWHTRADVTEDVSPAAMRATIGAAVDIALHADANPGCFPGGIPEDQARQLAEYVRNGAPCW